MSENSNNTFKVSFPKKPNVKSPFYIWQGDLAGYTVDTYSLPHITVGDMINHLIAEGQSIDKTKFEKIWNCQITYITSPEKPTDGVIEMDITVDFRGNTIGTDTAKLNEFARTLLESIGKED